LSVVVLHTWHTIQSVSIPHIRVCMMSRATGEMSQDRQLPWYGMMDAECIVNQTTTH
jgi:hypothetical protein